MWLVTCTDQRDGLPSSCYHQFIIDLVQTLTLNLLTDHLGESLPSFACVSFPGTWLLVVPLESTVFDSLSDRLSTPCLTPCRLGFCVVHTSSWSQLIDGSVTSSSRVTRSRARFARLVGFLRSGAFEVRLEVRLSLFPCHFWYDYISAVVHETSRSFSPEVIVCCRLQES